MEFNPRINCFSQPVRHSENIHVSNLAAEKILEKVFKKNGHKYNAEKELRNLGAFFSKISTEIEQAAKGIEVEKEAIAHEIEDTIDFNALFWKNCPRYLDYFSYLVQKNEPDFFRFKLYNKAF